MQPLKNLSPCACQSDKQQTTNKPPGQDKISPRQLITGLLLLSAWFLIYKQLLPFSNYLTYQILGLEQGSHLGAAIQFFIYDSPKVMMLLTLIVFGVGIIRSYFTPERTRKILAGRRESVGNVLAALLGIVTPFCSCSAVPLFLGFVQAGVPLGVTFSFLIAAPMVNEVALVLLYGLLGWKVAALYLLLGLSVAIVGGWIIGRLKLEHLIEDWVQEMRSATPLGFTARLTWSDRIDAGRQAVKDIVTKVWPYVIAGIGAGAAIHGYVPENFMASIMGKDAWWSVPAAVVIGIPMYSNAAGIVPVLEALLGKGAALGTALAFMMSVIALSLPEMVILRKVLKPKLIAIFIGVVGSGILLVGFLFNILI